MPLRVRVVSVMPRSFTVAKIVSEWLMVAIALGIALIIYGKSKTRMGNMLAHAG